MIAFRVHCRSYLYETRFGGHHVRVRSALNRKNFDWHCNDEHSLNSDIPHASIVIEAAIG